MTSDQTDGRARASRGTHVRACVRTVRDLYFDVFNNCKKIILFHLSSLGRLATPPSFITNCESCMHATLLNSIEMRLNSSDFCFFDNYCFP